MPTKTILFDLDGTLTDSGEGIIRCVKVALAHFKIPVEDESALRIFVGPPLYDSFARFGVAPENVDEAVRIFRSRYNSVGKFENSLYPGIEELLRKLHTDGHTLFVATSKPEQTALAILEHFGLSPYFNRICGATMSRDRSSKADVITYLLSLAESLENAVMVGDTVFDVLGAAAHGIPTIGVAWGYGAAADMEKAGAAAIAHDTDELYRLLQT